MLDGNKSRSEWNFEVLGVFIYWLVSEWSLSSRVDARVLST